MRGQQIEHGAAPKSYRRLQFLSFALLIGVSLWKRFPGLAVQDSGSSHDESELTGTARRLSDEHTKPLRILYIVTTLAEYNNGHRSTAKGSDRLQETLIPVLAEGVESMLSMGYHVDVYLVCHWTMLPERLELIRRKLPPSVGLQYWDQATPIGYPVEGTKTEELIVHLSRQHRFVIKDKLPFYDFFLAFEDDMLIKGDHVKNYFEMSNELARLRTIAPDDVPKYKGKARDQFYGPLSKAQLKRLIPGLMRVEVLLDEDRYGAQKEMAPIPVDLEFDGVNRTVDPQPCCHVSEKTSNDHIPTAPTADKIFIWETGIKGLSIREVQSLGWVMLQAGPTPSKAHPTLGDYWTGRNGVFGESRPGGRDTLYLSNQGGWMATRQQLFEWHTEICPGGYLPAFDPSDYRLDGLDMRNVEYWSGGLNLFTARHACNLQRIVSLDPDKFSRHLLYHSANNKQKQLTWKKDRFVKVNDLLGQLNTVRKRAEEAKKNETM